MKEKRMDLGRGRQQRRAKPGCGWRGGHGGEGISIMQRNWQKSSVWMGMRLRRRRVLLERLEEGERLKLALFMGASSAYREVMIAMRLHFSAARSMKCFSRLYENDGD